MTELKNKIERQWYAIYTKSRCEKKVKDYLDMAGVTGYVPLRIELHKWSDRKKKVEVPVIHSYVFVYINYDNERAALYKAPGFVNFVCHDRKPVAIPQKEIDLMKRTVDSSYAIQVESGTLRVGKKVRILTGPLEGAIGIVQDLEGHKVNIVLSAVNMTMVVDLTQEVEFETVNEEDEE